MRIAALDLGSNSFHLLVADVHPDGTFDAGRRREGDAAPRRRRRPRRPDLAVVGRPRGRERAPPPPARRRAGAQEVIAKATSAIRTAANGSELVDRIEAETGVEVEVINGLEEARLIFAAIRASLVLEPAPALCVDIGGGSVEIMIGDAAGLRWATSVPLGVGRLTAELVALGPAVAAPTAPRSKTASATGSPRSSTRCAAASRGWRSARAAPSTTSPGWPPRARTATSPRARTACASTPSASRALQRRIVRMSTRRAAPAARHRGASGPSSSPRASTLLATIFELFEIDEMVTSDWALREGIVLDAVQRPRSRRLVRRSARAAARRGRGPRAAVRLRPRALAARRAPRAEPVRPDAASCTGSATTTARCSSTRRCCTTSASTCRARATTGTRPTSSTTRNCAASRPARSSSSPRSCGTTGAATSRPRSRASPRSTRTRANGCASSPRSSGSPTVSTAAAGASSTGVDVEIGTDLVVLRLHTRDDAELELWGVRRRRDLFEKVFERELEATVARRGPTARPRRRLSTGSGRTEAERPNRPWISTRTRRRCDNPPHPAETSSTTRDRRGAARPSTRGACRESDAPRARDRDAGAHPRRRRAPRARARPERLQHGRAREGGRRRARDRVRALPFEARGARRARVVDVAVAHAREPRSATSAIRSPRCATCSARCAGTGHEHEAARARAAHARRGHRRRRADRRRRRRLPARASSTALAAGGHLRPRWSADDAVDALALLTSYATYERLRASPDRTPEQIEAVLAKLAVSIVSPATHHRSIGSSSGPRSRGTGDGPGLRCT